MSSKGLLGLVSYSDDEEDDYASKDTKSGLVSYDGGDAGDTGTETKEKPIVKAILHKPDASRRLTPSATPTHSPTKTNISNLIRIHSRPSTPPSAVHGRHSPMPSPLHRASTASPARQGLSPMMAVNKESEDLERMDLDERGEAEDERRRRDMIELLWPRPIESQEDWGIPPEPEEECDPDLQAKVDQFHALRADGTQFNDHLYKSKAFRNPHIYAKLVEFVDLDEIGSNFPKETFNPHGFPVEAYADELIETQKRRAEERAAEQVNRINIQFVPGSGGVVAPVTRTGANPVGFRMRSDAKDIVMGTSGAGTVKSSSLSQADVKKKRSSKWDVAATGEASAAVDNGKDQYNKRRK